MALEALPNSLPSASNETPVKDFEGSSLVGETMAAAPVGVNPYSKSSGSTTTTPLYVINIPFTTNGSAFNATFPAAVKVANYTFAVNVGLVGVMLTSSVTNNDPLVVAIQIGRDNLQANANATDSTDFFLSHIFQENSTAVSQNSATSFGEDLTVMMSAGESLAIYVSAANDATVLMAGQAQLWFYKV